MQQLLDQKLKNLELIEKEYKNAKQQFEQVTQENIQLKLQQELEMIKLINQQEDEQNKLKQEFTLLLSEKEQQLQEAQMQLIQLNRKQSEEDKSKKIELDAVQTYNHFIYFQIEQYQNSLIFSQTLKHSNCQVSDNGKVIAEISNDRNSFYCLCDQAIPKTGKVQIAFQILCGSKLKVGICMKDILKKNNYLNCFSFGFGTYLLDGKGKTCSHHINDNNLNESAIKYQTNDIIIIEVCIEQKYIKWNRQNDPQTTVLERDTSQELHPCVGGLNFKIKILDKVSV